MHNIEICVNIIQSYEAYTTKFSYIYNHSPGPVNLIHKPFPIVVGQGESFHCTQCHPSYIS